MRPAQESDHCSSESDTDCRSVMLNACGTSDCVLAFSPSHSNGQAAHSQLQYKGHFVRGARAALACIKREPTLFVTVSRNFHS